MNLSLSFPATAVTETTAHNETRTLAPHTCSRRTGGGATATELCARRSVMVLTHAMLDDIRAECMADDIDIDLKRMQDWTEAEACTFFDSGGMVAPPPKQLRSVAAVMADAGVEPLDAQLEHERMADWLVRLRRSRHDLLRRLKVCGMSSLSHRQAVVNALAKAWREGRVPPDATMATGAPAEPSASALPPPVELWREAVAVIAEIRAWSAEELAARLSSDDLRATCLAVLARAGAALSAAQLMRMWSTDSLGDLLEARGWSLDRVRLMLDGCGLSERVARPRLGQPLAFWSNQMGERGTEVAMYDYADFAERCLGLTSWIVHPRGQPHVVAKFRRRFGTRCLEVDGFDHVGPALVSRGIARLYVIKEGTPHVPSVRFLPRSVRALVHCVFHAKEPHGEIYAKISPCVDGDAPVVPHIVRPRDPHGPDMRNQLGIPPGAIVFGRHGGLETFSVDFARDAVVEVATARRDIYFVFLNTYPMHELLPNIIYLERTSDEEEVARFIRTCDAMLHARSGGETFGLACAEFSAHNRPVLTSSVHDDYGHGRMHLDVLATNANCPPYFYRDHVSLVALLMGFKKQHAASLDFNAYRAFEPARVMTIFEKVFLGGPPPLGAPTVLTDEELGLVTPCVPINGAAHTNGASHINGVSAANGAAATNGAAAHNAQMACRSAGEQRWVEACEKGTLCLEACGRVQLPGANGIFLASCRIPPAGAPTGGGATGGLVHVFRSDALATFDDSAIMVAHEHNHGGAGKLFDGTDAALRGAARLNRGEDPRVFAHAGKVYVVDNTLNGCRLIELANRGHGGAARVYRVALSGKNLTFLPCVPPQASPQALADDDSSAQAELLLVHWFMPLRVYRVTLPDDPTEEFATLECIFAEGEDADTHGATAEDGSHAEAPIEIGDAPARDARADEFRGGTPGRPAAPGTWWGLLHRTHFKGNTLRHDPFAWVVRRTPGTSSFAARLTKVEVRGRPATSNVLDPCCVIDGEARPTKTGAADADAEGAADADVDDHELWVTTAESETGWFEPQEFRTGVWRLMRVL